MPDRVKPKRVALSKLASLLELPEGVTVASVGSDADTATLYLAGADSRRMPLADLAALLDVASIDVIGTDGDDVVVVSHSAPAAKSSAASKKAGS